jgi:alpha-glucosidase
VNWHTGESSVGPRLVTAPAPIERIPMFARGGRVIPMFCEAPASTLGYHPDTLDLLVVVPESDGVFQSDLQEDDGVSFAALTGAHLRTRFVLTRSAKRIHVVATVSGNGYPEFRRARYRLIVLNADPVHATVDGAPLVFRDGQAEIDNRGSGFQLAFDV